MSALEADGWAAIRALASADDPAAMRAVVHLLEHPWVAVAEWLGARVSEAARHWEAGALVMACSRRVPERGVLNAVADAVECRDTEALADLSGGDAAAAIVLLAATAASLQPPGW